MILAAAAQFAWASAQVAPADRRMTKMELTASQLAHYMAPGVNLGKWRLVIGMISLPTTPA